MGTQISGVEQQEEVQSLAKAPSSIVKDASLALESLGFAKNLCYGAAAKVFAENPELSLQDLIKQSIKHLKEPR
jgi:Holliday junction resolvasome RuvABC DNA-binding subunit